MSLSLRELPKLAKQTLLYRLNAFFKLLTQTRIKLNDGIILKFNKLYSYDDSERFELEINLFNNAK